MTGLLAGWLATTAAVAASFDCTKAATRDEKLICADPALSKLDDDLGRRYSGRLREVSDPAELRSTQIAWLEQRRTCVDIPCIEAAYRGRLAALTNLRTQSFPEREARSVCVTESGRKWQAEKHSCTVGTVTRLGVVGKLAMHAVSYCLLSGTRKPDAKKCEHNAITVFSHKPGDTHWVAQVSYDDVRHEEPALDPGGVALYRHGPAYILYLPARLDGTGSINVSRHYTWNNQRWELIDTDAWVADLKKRLPPGSEFWKGIWYDMKSLTSHVGIYRKGDGNCCPSGGIAKVSLALNGTRLVLKSFIVEKESPP